MKTDKTKLLTRAIKQWLDGGPDQPHPSPDDSYVHDTAAGKVVIALAFDWCHPLVAYIYDESTDTLREDKDSRGTKIVSRECATMEIIEYVEEMEPYELAEMYEELFSFRNERVLVAEQVGDSEEEDGGEGT